MALARVITTQQVEGNKNFTVPFPYLHPSDIVVRVDGVETPFSWLNPNTIHIDPAPPVGSIVYIQRETQRTNLLVNFKDGSTLTESELNLLAIQNFYLAQEAFDRVQDSIADNGKLELDAGDRRIINVANPIDGGDAVNKRTLQYEYPMVETVAKNIGMVNIVGSDLSSVGFLRMDLGYITDEPKVEIEGETSAIRAVAEIKNSVQTVSYSIGQVRAVGDNIDHVVNVSENIDDVIRIGQDIATVIETAEPLLDALDAIKDTASIKDDVITVAATKDTIEHVSEHIEDILAVPALAATASNAAAAAEASATKAEVLVGAVDLPKGVIPVFDRPSLDLGLTWERNLDNLVTYNRLGPKTYFDKYGILRTAADNEWPLEYDPITHEPLGRSVWEARTNLLKYSEQFDNATWTKSSNTTVTGGAALAPDGTTTACAIQGTSGTAIKRVYQWHATSDQGPWTFSVFLKAGTEKNALVNIIGLNSGVTVGQLRGRVNLETGTFSAVDSEGIGSGATITLLQELPGGWWRVGITGHFAGDLTHVRAEVWLDGYTSTTSTGNLYAWGAQLEAGSSASPYIPTSGSAVTRSAEVVSITGANFSRWFNPDEGTFVVKGSSTRTDSNITFVQARNESNSGEVRILRGMTSAYASLLFVRDDSIGQAINVAQVGTPIDGTTYTIAAAYKRNDLAISRDGAAPTTHTAAEVPGGLDRFFIGSNNGASQFINGHIRRIVYYPKRLSNAELEALSTPNAAVPGGYLRRNATNDGYETVSIKELAADVLQERSITSDMLASIIDLGSI